MVNTVKYLFEEVFNKKISEIPFNKFIDVSEFNIGIESYNHIKGEVEFNRINKIIRKDISEGYEVKGENFTFICSLNHRMYIKTEKYSKGVYKEVEDIIKMMELDDVFTLNEDNKWVRIYDIKNTKNKTEILDFEVANVHNYFSDGVLSHNSYGDNNVTKGGKALGYYVRTRIKTSRQNSKGIAGESSGNTFELVKANYGNEKKKVETRIVYGQGIDKTSELIDFCTKLDVFEKSGSWFSYKGTKLANGKNAFIEVLKDNVELYEELEEIVRTHIKEKYEK